MLFFENETNKGKERYMGTNPCLGRGDYVDLFTEASLLEPGCSDPTKGVRRARAYFFDRVLRTKTFEFWSVVDGKRVQKRLTLEMFKRPDLVCGGCGKGDGVHVVSGDNASVETTWCGHCQKVVTHMRSFFPLPTTSFLLELGLDPHVREVANRTEGETE